MTSLVPHPDRRVAESRFETDPRNETSVTLREYRLDRNVGSVVGLLARMDGVSSPSCESSEDTDPRNAQVMVRMQGQTVELQHLDPQDLMHGEQARVRLCVTLVPVGEHTKAEISVQQPCFMDAVVRGDIVPEAVGWGAAIAISFFQGLLSGSLEAALISFGISALGLLAVRLGTAYSVWKRGRRSVQRDLGDLLQRVHGILGPASQSPISRY